MTYKKCYDLWLSSDAVDEKTKAELMAISNDEKEIEDRFYKDLEFGTAGLRGVLGAGTNRMNVYTVKKTTQGLADYILANFPDGKNMGV
ncbi:MAG: phospho-sugar mutase, partial [Clostridia bacterium]|nr:phospho-sugar mutase [Clostridia bacterium]